VRAVFAPSVLLIVISCPVGAAVSAVDDTGQVVTLAAPARRIVSLAPNYPAQARTIRRIGGSGGIDYESIVALRPDLIVAWASGTPPRTVTRLRRLGFPVYLAQSRRLDDIALNLERLGQLVGTETIARAASKRFILHYQALAARYADRSPVSVFYQVLDPQLITVNDDHLVNQIIRLCGGVNVFATLPVLAPVVDEEAVLKADPQAIVAGGTDKEWRAWQAHWRERATLAAVKRGALYFIPADLIHRDTLRVLDGAERLCEALEDARRRR
jgi:iron complex transport system substrate-binding protein